MEAVDGRYSVLPGALITQRSDDVDVFADQGRRVEIRWRKDRLRIAEDVNGSVGFMDKYVFIDAKVLIVEVLVFSWFSWVRDTEVVDRLDSLLAALA